MHEVQQVRELTNCLRCIGYGAILRQYVNQAVQARPGVTLELLTQVISESGDEWRRHVLEDEHAAQ